MFKWLAFFFSNDVFLKNILFLDVCYCKLNRLQYSVNTTFICTGKQKNLCDSLYCDTQFMVLVGTEAALSLRSADTRVLGLPFNNLFFHFIIFLNFLFCRESCSVMSDSLQPHGLHIVHGILQARILEWVAFPFSRGSSQPRYWTQVSHIAAGFFTSWATREAQEYWSG